MKNTIREGALLSAQMELVRQDAKWSEQNHDPFTYLTILGEEFGEVCQAALHSKFGGPKADGLRTEAVQVAAVALAIVECLDRDKWVWAESPQDKQGKIDWLRQDLSGEKISENNS